MSPAAPFWGPTLDCPEPLELAEFYQQVAGGELAVVHENFVELRFDTVSLGFQRDLNYRAPTWPDTRVPQQCHLDFSTADLDRQVAGEVVAELIARISGKRMALTVTRRVPLLGGAVGAGVDGWSTYRIGEYADKSLVRRIRRPIEP